MKLKSILLASVLSLSSFMTSFAQSNYGPAYADAVCTEDDVCWKIDSLYENEANASLRQMQTQTLKAYVHPDRYKSVQGYAFLCQVPYDDQLRYRISTIGFDATYPRYCIEGGYLKTYGKQHTVEELEGYKNFINGVKAATGGMNQMEKLDYLQELLSQRFEYDLTPENIHKLNDVLKLNKGVCTGYSGLFYLCCINIGIPCECVGNHDHMWNKVMIDGAWKYIDCTWNDSIGWKKWFLQNENELDETHQLLNCFRTP